MKTDSWGQQEEAESIESAKCRRLAKCRNSMFRDPNATSSNKPTVGITIKEKKGPNTMPRFLARWLTAFLATDEKEPDEELRSSMLEG